MTFGVSPFILFIMYLDYKNIAIAEINPLANIIKIINHNTILNNFLFIYYYSTSPKVSIPKSSSSILSFDSSSSTELFFFPVLLIISSLTRP